MITIVFPSGKVTPTPTEVAATAGVKKGGVHLTRGYISPDVFPVAAPGESGIHLKGEVDLLADTQADVNQILTGAFFIGFIQIARVKNWSARWEGRRTGEGSVDLRIVGFPVSGDIVGLDSDPRNQPFFNRLGHGALARRAQPGQRRQVHVTTSMDDPPNYRDFLVTPNSLTKSDNFLHLMFFEVEFTSVLVAKVGTGPIQPIAHIIWKIDLSGEFRWAGGKATGNKKLSSLKIGNSISGPPTDRAVKAILDNPGPPLIKGFMNERARSAATDPRMRVESVERSLLVPKDFFR